MNLRRSIAASVAALSLVLALAVSPVAAVSTGGTTTESLSIPSAISFTAPASVTYSGVKLQMSAVLNLTASTDNGAGMTITVLANADGVGKIQRVDRVFNQTVGGGLTTVGSLSPFNEFPGLVAESSAPVASGTITVTSFVFANAYAPGEYTGTLVFVAATK